MRAHALSAALGNSCTLLYGAGTALLLSPALSSRVPLGLLRMPYARSYVLRVGNYQAAIIAMLLIASLMTQYSLAATLCSQSWPISNGIGIVARNLDCAYIVLIYFNV